MDIHIVDKIFRFRFLLIALISALFAGCSDELDLPDYVEVGKDMEVKLSVALPEMEVKTRGDISEDLVSSVWIATFAATGEITSKGENGGWYSVDVKDYTGPHREDASKPDCSYSIETKSGPSYIVAVANVENDGVTRNDHAPKPLSDLLKTADTWDKFLNIGVVAPSTRDEVNAPVVPLVMAGCYINEEHPANDYESWQTRDFVTHTIPATGTGQFTMPGKIHLRRLVSQVTFNIFAGKDVTVTPTSYTVVNAPAYSWLYERGGNSANFGDICDESNRSTYYKTPAAFESNLITTTEVEMDGSKRKCHTFDFWQAENKHTGLETCTDYDKRDKYTGEGNDMLFTGLTGDRWSNNNMASYVLINCSVDYKESMKVDDNGYVDESTGKVVYRTGTTTFIVHLGYINDISRDFNCYRNVKYTYNLTVNGLNDVRLEAVANDETPGVEGLVSDLENPTVFLDCHYHQFNVYLSKDELQKWEIDADGKSKGFGFIITTYDNHNGGMKTYDETYFVDNYPGKSYDEIISANPGIKKYIDWIEFRKTEEGKYALYQPRGDGSGETFNLLDASLGEVADNNTKLSSKGWYTVFVKEYTYEYSGRDESDMSVTHNKPQWFGYVNADPRQFYIRVTKAVSRDGKSLYARAKYGTVQKSIMTYYSTEHPTTKDESSSGTPGSALGVEHSNESYGLNLRSSFNPGGFTADNGRYNCAMFTGYSGGPGGYQYLRGDYNWWTGTYSYSWTQVNSNGWDYYVNRSTVLTIPTSVNPDGNALYLPQIYPDRPSDKDGNSYSPQKNASAADAYLEAISACLNRNRDNDGDGIIDKEEIRWFVPSSSQYIRVILGNSSLGSDPIVNFNNITGRPSGISSNGYWGNLLFFASNRQIVWAMEGLSTGNWGETDTEPWQVRCVRNLGTNLDNDISYTGPTIPAYKVTKNADGSAEVVPVSYNLANLRTISYSGNGQSTGQMPVHSFADYDYNAIYRYGFDVDATQTWYEKNDWIGWRDIINGKDDKTKNACSSKGGGWRLPNASEIAVMQAAGIIDEYCISCTMAPFDDSGNKVTPYTNTSTTHFFIKANKDRIIQGNKDNGFYFRCVKDK